MLSIDEETEQLTVRFGIMKMNVGIGEIESLSGQKADPKPKETKKKPLSQEQRKKQRC